jgi:predicted nucleotidyltransferase
MIPTLKTVLEQDENVTFAYLFGSYANDTHHSQSDVDIAVWLKNDKPQYRIELLHRLCQATQKDVDLVVLNTARNLYLCDDIISNGIVLKEDEERLLYEVRKHHELLDYEALKRSIDAA